MLFEAPKLTPLLSHHVILTRAALDTFITGLLASFCRPVLRRGSRIISGGHLLYSLPTLLFICRLTHPPQSCEDQHG